MAEEIPQKPKSHAAVLGEHIGLSTLAGLRKHVLSESYYNRKMPATLEKRARNRGLSDYHRSYRMRCVLPPATAEEKKYDFIDVEKPAELLGAIAAEKPVIIDTIGGVLLARNTFPHAAVISYTDDYHDYRKEHKSERVPLARATLDLQELFTDPDLIPEASQHLADTLWGAITTEQADGRRILKENAAAILDNITCIGFCRHTTVLERALKALDKKVAEYGPEAANLMDHLKILNLSPLHKPILDSAGDFRTLDVIVSKDPRFKSFNHDPREYDKQLRINPKADLRGSTALSSDSLGVLILKAKGLPPGSVTLHGKNRRIPLGFHDAGYHLHRLEEDYPGLLTDLTQRTDTGMQPAELHDYLYEKLMEIQPATLRQHERGSDHSPEASR